MPPQNGKSSLVAHWFPVWYLDRRPDHRIAYVSYAAEYAAQWGLAVRNSIVEHSAKLAVRVSPARAAADEWQTTAGGGMVCVGRDGALTGRRANVLIVDDPFKNDEEANSPTIREKVWRFFLSAAYTRLTPDGIIVIVMTRWHEDDLVGRLKREQDRGGEKWEQVNLRAVAREGERDELGRKPGEPLWPERWPLPALQRIKRAIGSYFWGALYDQDPKPPEGTYFKRSWFKTIRRDRVPRLEKEARCWDLAATTEEESADPDRLAGVRMGRGEDGRYYVLHCHAARETPKGVEATIQQFGASDGRRVMIRVEQEGAASGKIVKYHYERMMDGWDCRFTGIPRASKLVRSGPFNAACERGDVLLVEGEWNADWLEEIVGFPHAAHDDRVDASVGGYEALANDVPEWTAEDVRRSFDGEAISLDEPAQTERW